MPRALSALHFCILLHGQMDVWIAADFAQRLWPRMWYSWERFTPSSVKFACFQPVRIMMFTQVGNPDIAISRLPTCLNSMRACWRHLTWCNCNVETCVHVTLAASANKALVYQIKGNRRSWSWLHTLVANCPVWFRSHQQTVFLPCCWRRVFRMNNCMPALWPGCLPKQGFRQGFTQHCMYKL